MSDPRLSELRLVKWELEGARAPRQELVAEAEAELLVRAVRRLHLTPGLNPHSGRPAARLLWLGVGTPRGGDGAWWSAPSLDETGPRAHPVLWSWDLRYAEDDGEPPDPH